MFSLFRAVYASLQTVVGDRIELSTFRFQEVYHPESTYLEKAPAVQLTRIGADRRLFFVPLTRITSVPGCAVSSVGILWGSAAVSRRCGVFVGLAEALGWPAEGAPVP